jgi:uncharacterized membrane protein
MSQRIEERHSAVALRDLEGARSRASAVILIFVLTLMLGVILVTAFNPSIQTMPASDLVHHRTDARAFLLVDYGFIALYALLSPIAFWRFGRELGETKPPMWIQITVSLLVLAGLLDLAENSLLLSSTTSQNRQAVDAAHALSIALNVLFFAGVLMSVFVVVKAARALQRWRGPATSVLGRRAR